jgi:hypothetical protein
LQQGLGISDAIMELIKNIYLIRAAGKGSKLEKIKKVFILSRRGFFYLQDVETDERLKNCHGCGDEGSFETREAAIESAKYHGYEIKE